jgi:Lytic transglycolase
MEPFRVHSRNRCSGKPIHFLPNFGWPLQVLLPIGWVIIFAIGCAHTASVRRPLAWSSHRASAEYLSDGDARQGEHLGKTRIVTASWYGPGYEGKRTSSGQPFDPNRLTAASNTLPLDSIVRVTNLRNGRSVYVKVNDRGPANTNRALDLSPAAARKIGLTRSGVARVKITPASNTAD